MLEEYQMPLLHSAIAHFKMKSMKDYSAAILEFETGKKENTQLKKSL